jgi:hypothetical protein
MAGGGPPSTTLLLAARKVVDGPPSRAMTVRVIVRGNMIRLFPDESLS